MSQSLSNIGLTGNYEIGQVGWGDSFNESLEVIDSLLQPIVNSFIDYKPTDATEGSVYIVSTSTKEPELIPLKDYLVVYTKKSWFYIKPKKQFSVFIVEKNQVYVYNERGWNQDNVSAKVGDIEAFVQTDRLAVANDVEALARKVDTLQATYKGDIQSTVNVTQESYANQYETFSKLVTKLNSTFMDKLNAAITSESLTRANDTEALSQKIDTLAASTKDGNSALIQQEQQARATQFESLVKVINKLQATTGDVQAGLNTETIARTTANSAMYQSISDAKAQISADTAAQIKQESDIRASSVETIAKRVDNISAVFNGSVQSAIKDEAIARSTAIDALSQKTTDMYANFSSNIGAQIQQEVQARSTADESTVKQVNDLSTKFSKDLSDTKDQISSDTDSKIQVLKNVVDSKADFTDTKNAISDASKAATEQVQNAQSDYNKKIDTLATDTNTGISTLTQKVVDTQSNIDSFKKTYNDDKQSFTEQVDSAKSSFQGTVDTYQTNTNNTITNLNADLVAKITKVSVDSQSSIDDVKKTINTNQQASTEQINSAKSQFQTTVDEYSKNTDGKLQKIGDSVTATQSSLDTFKNTYNNDKESSASQIIKLTSDLNQTITDSSKDATNQAVTQAKGYADQQFSTKSDLGGAKTELNTTIGSSMKAARDGAVSDAQSWANSQFISQTDATKSISGSINTYDSNMIVGGRNYIKHSDAPTLDYFWYDKGNGNDGNVVFDKTKYICNLTNSTQITDISVKQRLDLTKVTDTNLVLSVDVLQVSGNVSARIVTSYAVGNTYYSNSNMTYLPGKLVQTIKLPINHTDLVVWLGVVPRNIGNTGTVVYEYPQLEIGTKPTQWSPNPDDIAQQLTANASATQSLTTSVQQQGDKLTSQANYNLELSAQLSTDPGNIIKNSSLIYSNLGWNSGQRVSKSDAPSGMLSSYGLKVYVRDTLYSPNNSSATFDTALLVNSSTDVYIESFVCVQNQSKLTIPLLLGCIWWDVNKNPNWVTGITVQPKDALTWTKVKGNLTLPSNAVRFLPWVSLSTFTDFDGNNWFLSNPLYKLTNEMTDVKAGISANANAIQQVNSRVDQTNQGLQSTAQSVTDLKTNVNNSLASLDNKYITQSTVDKSISSNIQTFSTGLQAGSTNKVPDSDSMLNWNLLNCSINNEGVNSAAWATFGGNSVLRITSTNDQATAQKGVWKSITSIAEGTPVVASVWVYGTPATVGHTLFLGNETIQLSTDNPKILAGWNRLYVKGTWRKNNGNNALIIYTQFNSPGDYIYITRPKLEIGNILTDWSPAPEDISNRVANAESYSQSVRQAVTDLNQTYTTNRINDLSRLGNAESTLSTINSTYVKPGDVGSLVSTQMSTITSTEVSKQLDTLQIGGTNLLPYTKTFYGWRSNNASITTEVSYKDFTVTKAISQFNYFYLSISLDAGQTYTISGMVRSPTAGTDVAYYAYNAGGVGHYKIQQANTWEKFSTTFVANSNYVGHRLESYNNNTLYVAALKLEKGSKATDWSPSDKDTIIGGENLVLNSEAERVQENSSGSENYIFVSTPQLEANTVYTLSADIRTEGNLYDPEIMYIDWNAPPNPFVYSRTVSANGNYTRSSLTFMTSSTVTTNNVIRVDNNGSKDGSNTKVFARRFKLEKGNVATDWSLSTTELQGKFNKIVVGGNNLVVNSNFSNGDLNGFGWVGGVFSFLTDPVLGSYLNVVSPNNGTSGVYWGPSLSWVVNQTYTLSAYFRNVTNDFTFGIEGATGAVTVNKGIGNGQWVRVSTQCTKQNMNGACVAYISGQNSSYDITRIKLEVGNVLTDWTPADFDKNALEADPANLFSKSTAVGAWINGNGDPVMDNNNLMSANYLSCKEGNYFTFSMYDDIPNADPAFRSYLAFYDSNKKVISVNMLGAGSAFSKTYQAPKNAAFLKACAPKTTDIVRMKLEKGKTQTAWSLASGDATSISSLNNYKATIDANYYTKDVTDGRIRTISAGKLEQYSVGISAGGSNKLLNTDFTFTNPLDGWNSNGSINSVNSDNNVTSYNGSTKSCSITATGGSSQGLYRYVNNIPTGSDITLSIWIYADLNAVGLGFNMGYEVATITWNSACTMNEDGSIAWNKMTLKSGWNLYKSKGTWRNNGNCTFYVEFTGQSQHIYMSRPMLSVGKLFPDWSPCPDDVSTATGNLATAMSNIYTKQETDGKITSVISGKKEEFVSTVNLYTDNKVKDVNVGGRNYFTKTTSVSNIQFTNYINRSDTGFTANGRYQNDAQVRIWNVVNGAGDYTISFDHYIGSGPFVLSIDINDQGMASFTAVQGWGHYSLTINTGNTSNNWIDINGLTAQDHIFKNVKIEKGNKATDWTPAPEDIYSKTDVDAIVNAAKQNASDNLNSMKSAIGENINAVNNNLTNSINNVNGSLTNSINTTAQNAKNDLNNLRIGGTNLYSTSKASLGFITDNGGLSGTTNDTVSDFIYFPDIPQVTVTIFDTSFNISNTVIGFYDGNKNFIGKWGGAGTATFDGATYKYATRAVAVGTRYIRVSVNDGGRYNNQVKVEAGNRSTSWTPSPDDVTNNVTTAVNNIQVGGNNLLDNTNFDFDNNWDGWYANSSNLTVTTDDSLMRFAGTNRVAKVYANQTSGAGIWRPFNNPPAGVPITVSAWARTFGGTCQLVVGNECCNVYNPQTVTGSWTRIVVKGISNGSGNCTFYFSAPTGWEMLLGGLQVEVGTVATAWAPAYRDINAATSKLSTKITPIAQTVNGISGVYGVAIDNNGVISGFGLYSDLVNGRVTSTFGVNADNFYIGNPRDGKKMFTVNNGYTTIQNAFIPTLQVSSLSTLLTPDGQLGTFTGNTSSGRLTISGTCIEVFDNNGVRRVRLGLW